MTKKLWTKSGCIKCEDLKNANIYDNLEGLVEHSIDTPEGLALAVFYGMWTPSGLSTPCLYIGKDLEDEEVTDVNNIRLWQDEIKEYLEEL